MKQPCVLVACEESGRVTEALRNVGVIAFSADILPTSGNHPEWHIQGDVLPILNGDCDITVQTGKSYHFVGRWDAIIAFPPCTYLTNASAVRMRVKGEIVQSRYLKMLQGKAFFMAMLNADCDCIAVENPVPMKMCQLPKYDQIIQPWQFGHHYSKRTCLWLKNLPKLTPTEIITENITPWIDAGSMDKYGNQRPRRGRLERDPITRSKTFPGIAEAMADQWGSYLKERLENE